MAGACSARRRLRGVAAHVTNAPAAGPSRGGPSRVLEAADSPVSPFLTEPYVQLHTPGPAADGTDQLNLVWHTPAEEEVGWRIVRTLLVSAPPPASRRRHRA